mgnify:CR=1 FL=1
MKYPNSLTRAESSASASTSTLGMLAGDTDCELVPDNFCDKILLFVIVHFLHSFNVENCNKSSDRPESFPANRTGCIPLNLPACLSFRDRLERARQAHALIFQMRNGGKVSRQPNSFDLPPRTQSRTGCGFSLYRLRRKCFVFNGQANFSLYRLVSLSCLILYRKIGRIKGRHNQPVPNCRVPA